MLGCCSGMEEDSTLSIVGGLLFQIMARALQRSTVPPVDRKSPEWIVFRWLDMLNFYISGEVASWRK